ncbi:MAG: hypothetical protein K8S98_03615 [Planctomycetes bacterium]|nr:hypothetical protein [Planctomycetota bacterium]
MKPADLHRLTPELAALAVECAKELGGKLDGSRKSAAEVERLLGLLHDEYVERPDEEGADRRSFEFAAYLITLFEREGVRGAWQPDHPERGPGSFPFKWQGRDHFVVDWCWTRIVEGPTVDVRSLFEEAVGASKPRRG